MSRTVRPDYAGGGFANLMASIIEASSGAPRHAPLTSLLPAELAEAQNILLLIVDGLGDNYLQREGAGGALFARRRGAPINSGVENAATALTRINGASKSARKRPLASSSTL